MPTVPRRKADALYPEYFGELLRQIPRSNPAFANAVKRRNKDNFIAWNCFDPPPLRLYAGANIPEKLNYVGIIAVGDADKRRYAKLQLRFEADITDQMERRTGQRLQWSDIRNAKNDYQVIARLTGADVHAEADWPRQHAWMKEQLIALYEIVGPFAL
jgi:hypothetical protein